MECTAQGVLPIFYNNFTWNISYKNVESLVNLKLMWNCK